ncbi:MAG: methyltransferase, partial [Alphaproteobacteria bacterium]|nr:methyltransferase [Alphaproteobacteria bacterium]
MTLLSKHILLVASSAIMVAATSSFTLDNSIRPASEVARDAARKPLEMVTFAKIAPGQTVVDMLPGGGYFTRIFAQAVGPSGHVVALVPRQFAERFPK